MNRAVLWTGWVIYLLLAADGVLGASPLLRMETRKAPTEAEYPRIHSPDVQWLSSIPLSRAIELSLPSASQLQKRATSRLQDPRSGGYGRATEVVVSTVTATRGESALRFSVISPGAIHLR